MNLRLLPSAEWYQKQNGILLYTKKALQKVKIFVEYIFLRKLYFLTIFENNTLIINKSIKSVNMFIQLDEFLSKQCCVQYIYRLIVPISLAKKSIFLLFRSYSPSKFWSKWNAGKCRKIGHFRKNQKLYFFSIRRQNSGQAI